MNGNGTMTWNEFCEASKNTVCSDSAITAKDEAKQQVRQLVMDLDAPDLDEAECPEDAVGNYCNAMKIQFSKSGDILNDEKEETLCYMILNFGMSRSIYLQKDTEKSVQEW